MTIMGTLLETVYTNAVLMGLERERERHEAVFDIGDGYLRVEINHGDWTFLNEAINGDTERFVLTVAGSRVEIDRS